MKQSSSKTMQAVWKGLVLAESSETIIIEGNHYFPPGSLNRDYFVDSDYTSTCPWKGFANYFTIEGNGKKTKNAAWTYLHPSPAASQIKDYVAFWKDVRVVEAPRDESSTMVQKDMNEKQEAGHSKRPLKKWFQQKRQTHPINVRHGGF